MKVIGETKEGYICTISKNEIDALLSLNDKRRGKDNPVSAGDELTFTTALTNLNLLKDLSAGSGYQSFGDYVTKAKGKIDEINEMLTSLNQPLIKIQSEIKTSQV